MEKLIINEPVITKTYKRYARFSGNERLMKIYHTRIKQQADEESGFGITMGVIE